MFILQSNRNNGFKHAARVRRTHASLLCTTWNGRTRFKLGNGQGIWASTNKRSRPGQSVLSPVTYSSRHKTGTNTLVNATTTWKQPVRCSYRYVYAYVRVHSDSVCEPRHNDIRHAFAPQTDGIEWHFYRSKTLTISCRCLVYIDSRSFGRNKSVHISLLPRLWIYCLPTGGTLLPYLACSQQT